jgi:hypothetical protein
MPMRTQHQLPLEIRECVARLLAGYRDRRRRDHDQSEQHDGRDQRERHRVDVQAASARAHRAFSCSPARSGDTSPCTAAAYTLPRCA